MKRGTITVSLTETERNHILQCLRIAIEDGSIYGGRHTPAQLAIINKRDERITAKIRGET